MKYLKSHFGFSKGQRNGIYLLLLLILVFQSVYLYVDFSSEDIDFDPTELAAIQHEIDSLKIVQIESGKPKIFPFNPNYISDFKGYTLGLSNEEIDRLHRFRDQNKWVNSARQFQQVTKISDSLLGAISPYFKFPDWISNPKPRTTDQLSNAPKTYEAKIDLNKATVQQLKRVNGIGEKLSERIIKFRRKFPDGFTADVQLQDIYGLSPEVVERVLEQFTVKTPAQIIKLNLNTATIEQLVTIQHIDYELAYEIIEQRKLRDGYKSLDDLLKVKDFPQQKIEIIKLYLMLE